MTYKYQDSKANVLAAQIAAHFGGEHVPMNADGEYYVSFAEIRVPATEQAPAHELSVDLRGYGAKKDRAEIRMYSTAKSQDSYNHGKAGEMGVDSNRDINAICKEIRRRLYTPENIEKLRAHEKRVAAERDRQASLEQRLAAMLARHKNVWVQKGAAVNDRSVTLYSQGKTACFNATLYPNGAVSFERIGSVSADQAARILDILAEG